MARHTNKNQNAVTEEPVVKEDSAKIMAEKTAEETAEETAEPITEKTVEEAANDEAEVTKVETTDKRRIVVVSCDKLYIRPEPNKKRDIGILSRGSKLFVNDTEERLPEGWLSVTTNTNPDGKPVAKPMSGYVVAEYVNFVE